MLVEVGPVPEVLVPPVPVVSVPLLPRCLLPRLWPLVEPEVPEVAEVSVDCIVPPVPVWPAVPVCAAFPA